jgi:hypothetical protein
VNSINLLGSSVGNRIYPSQGDKGSPRYPNQPSSGTVIIDWSQQRTVVQPITGPGPTQFQFLNAYLGFNTPMRLVVQYVGSPQSFDLTWLGDGSRNVWWSSPAPTKGTNTVDIFEFLYDGSVFYGMVIGQGFLPTP